MHGEDHSVPCLPLSLWTISTDLPALLQTAEGFEPLLSALRQGRSGVIDGAWGSSAALAAAALALHAPHTLVVVIAHPHDLDAWSGDLASFAGADPSIFPAWDDHRARPACR